MKNIKTGTKGLPIGKPFLFFKISELVVNAFLE